MILAACFAMASFYDTLGIPVDADVSAIRVAYKRRALEVHPDKGGTAAAFQRVLAAFEQLVDPVRRKAYDLRRVKRRPGLLV